MRGVLGRTRQAQQWLRTALAQGSLQWRPYFADKKLIYFLEREGHRFAETIADQWAERLGTSQEEKPRLPTSWVKVWRMGSIWAGAAAPTATLAHISLVISPPRWQSIPEPIRKLDAQLREALVDPRMTSPHNPGGLPLLGSRERGDFVLGYAQASRTQRRFRMMTHLHPLT